MIRIPKNAATASTSVADGGNNSGGDECDMRVYGKNLSLRVGPSENKFVVFQFN